MRGFGTIRLRRFLLLGCAAGVLPLLLGLDDTKEVPKIVDAQKFVLRDGNGKVRAELGFQAGGPSLALLDENGVCRARLVLSADGTPHFVFLDPDGRQKASLHVPANGEPRLKVEAENHHTPTVPTQPSLPKGNMPRHSGEREQATENLYKQLCIKCHGQDGRGRKSRNRSTVPDFTDAAWQKGQRNARLVSAILNGRGDEMPAFGDRITNSEARDLVNFIRAFGSPAGNSAESHLDDFDARLRQLQRQWDELDRQIKALRPSSEGTK